MSRYDGLQILRNELGDDRIQYQEVGGYEVCFDSPDEQRVEFFNDLIEPYLGQRPYSVVAKKGFGFS